VATLTASSTSATAGSTISVTGKYFGTHDPALDNTNGPAEIRLGSLTGPVLATADPVGADRTFTVNVTVPSDTPAGDTFLAATQKTATGTPVYGTPARQAFRVLENPSAPSGGSTGDSNKVTTTQPTAVPLSLAAARHAAKMRIRRASPSAQRIRAACSRRSATSASCRVKWVANGKSHSKRVVIKSQASAAAW
jgi:hypothetical protein